MEFKNYSRMSQRELANYRRRLAKTANERLRALERNDMKRFAYEKAQSFLYMTGERTRFTERKGMLDVNAERREIANLEKFLKSKSSTKTGLRKVYKGAYENIKEKYNLENISFEDYLKHIADFDLQSKNNSIGSPIALKMIDRAIGEGIEINDFLTNLSGVKSVKEGYNLIDEMKGNR
ncbi:MAG: hypothetical protein J6S67_17505 [Methanobrevibacter sp.]|nr:hypothetical protein [Methanobrevibacter sp.]